MSVSKAARGDGCERFVNSAEQSTALKFTRVTRAAAGRTHGLKSVHNQVQMLSTRGHKRAHVCLEAPTQIQMQ